MKSAFLHSFLRHASLGVMGVLLLMASAGLITDQISVIRNVRRVAVPLVAQLPEMERRVNVLKEQIELTELQSALRSGSQEERMKMFVLPEKTDRDRTVALFDVFHSLLKQSGTMSDTSSFAFSDPIPAEQGLTAKPLSIQYVIHHDGVRDLLQMIRLSGLLTIADTLTYEERKTLFERTEMENPAGIAVLEQYLSADLMDYVNEPRPHDEQLRRAFAGDAFRQELDDMLQGSFLRDAKRLFGGPLGKILQDRNLWPMPLMTVESVRLEPGSAEGWYRLDLVLHLYQRGQQ